MFNKVSFSRILEEISNSYESITEFAEKSGANRTYLSKYINQKLDAPPSPKVLMKIANNSKGITTYEELMEVCGHSEETLESSVYNIYKQLKELSRNIYKKNGEDLYEVESSIDTFQNYVLRLDNNLLNKSTVLIKLTDFYDKDFILQDYNFTFTFLFIYDSLLKYLDKENYIHIINYTFVDWFDMDKIYSKLSDVQNWELLSYNSKTVELKNELLNDAIECIKKFSTALNLSYLSDFDSNALTELFKKKIENNKLSTESKVEEKSDYTYKNNADKMFMTPVYGKIKAGEPNWAEQNIESYIPVAPSIYGLTNPDEVFYLKVDGESMNKVIKNDNYALIRKDVEIKDGDVVVALVNGHDATLKKYKRLNEQFVLLEPMSDDPSIESITVDLKTTEFKILGKMIGHFGTYN